MFFFHNLKLKTVVMRQDIESRIIESRCSYRSSIARIDRGNAGFPKIDPWKTMNTEDKVQGYSKGTNRSTASMKTRNGSCSLFVESASAKPEIFSDFSASSVSLPNNLSSSAAQAIWKERTAGSLSNDKKIGDEKNE